MHMLIILAAAAQLALPTAPPVSTDRLTDLLAAADISCPGPDTAMQQDKIARDLQMNRQERVILSALCVEYARGKMDGVRELDHVLGVRN